jgi:hypothetical protein
MSSRKNEKVKALLFDFGGTLAFLDFELLARDASLTRSRSSMRNTLGVRRSIDI